MTLMQLHYFKAICEFGSLSAAAEQIHIAPSTLSQCIKDLEDEFGVALMSRSNRGMTLTPDGIVFLEHANILLCAEKNLLHTMQDLSTNSFSITLGIPAITCDTIWPTLSQYIYAHCPGIKVNIITGTARDDLFRQLDAGEIDALIMIHPPEQIQSYNMLPLWPAPQLALVVSEHNALAKRDSVTFEDVVDLPLVRHVSDNKVNFLRALYAQHKKTPRFVETCEQLSTIMGLVRNDVAAAYLNTDIAQHYGGVKALLIPDQEEIYYYLIWSRMSKPHKPLLRFLNVINNLLLENDPITIPAESTRPGL